MKNPFLIKMPLALDFKIRRQLWTMWGTNHVRLSALIAGSVVVPLLAVFTLYSPASLRFDSEQFVSEVRSVQLAEAAVATTDIYHLVRLIEEGDGKTAYMISQGLANEPTEKRSDRVETFHHNENRRTEIESTTNAFGFEVFLGREDKAAKTLYHYGEATNSLSNTRSQYDTVHNLTALYESFTNLNQPAVPTVPVDATLISIDHDLGLARFRTDPAPNTIIYHFVDIKSKLLQTEQIYVVDEQQIPYELARISYLERSVIPTSEFATVFDPTSYNFAIIETLPTS